MDRQQLEHGEAMGGRGVDRLDHCGGIADAEIMISPEGIRRHQQPGPWKPGLPCKPSSSFDVI
jgi:hypothetical protein